ncbi:hypothetical protein [Haloarcula amylovorans]|uniref:hypothetical protein n=1 Tax=Haloarcula amylovorans TaxID=2562280 RepID=UPI0010764164|nr:hypothetical protein [Halomicroarcula amylolytica]
MVSVVGLVGLLVIVLVNSAVTALMTRFFRVRMNTRWGGLLYSILLCPVAMFVLFMVLATLGFGGDLTLGPGFVVFLTIVVPLAIGMTFDYIWMPAPDDVELPTSTN